MRLRAFAMLLAVLLLFGCRADTQARIVSLWERNLDEYQSAALAILSGAEAPKEAELTGVKDVDLWGGVQVDFTCAYRGFASSSGYCGFYYSADDIPRGFQGIELEFTEYGSGLLYEQPGGDNRCYVEKLADNWYYFEMDF